MKRLQLTVEQQQGFHMLFRRLDNNGNKRNRTFRCNTFCKHSRSLGESHVILPDLQWFAGLADGQDEVWQPILCVIHSIVYRAEAGRRIEKTSEQFHSHVAETRSSLSLQSGDQRFKIIKNELDW